MDRNICPNEGCDFSTADLNIRFCPRCNSLLLQITDEEKQWEGKVIDSKIRIRKVIGRGGMGIICEAEQIPLERRVAVKLLRRELYFDEQTIRRFLKEARAAAKLDHENIVSIMDFGQTATGVLYLVMEFLHGKTLREEINNKRQLPLNRVKQIAEGVCAALSHAHAKGVIHCDLKPENIFLARKEGQEVVKVLDFGIARIMGRKTQTDLGTIIGTPEYISPEQINAQIVDGRADLYSLACVLYECVVGEPPYLSQSPYTVFIMHMKGEFTPPTQRRPELSEKVDEFFKKALNPDRNERWQTAEEFKRAFLALPEERKIIIPPKPELTLPEPFSEPDFTDLHADLDKGKIFFKQTIYILSAVFAIMFAFVLVINLSTPTKQKTLPSVSKDIQETSEVLEEKTYDAVLDLDLDSDFIKEIVQEEKPFEGPATMTAPKTTSERVKPTVTTSTKRPKVRPKGTTPKQDIFQIKRY